MNLAENLADQVVLVTGGGQGIGAAIAHAFAAEKAAVIVNDLNADTAERTAAQIRGDGGRALALQADVSQRAAVFDMLAAARVPFGPVTTLINNAGYVPFKPLAEYTPELWDRALGVDLSGVFHCVQAALPQMEEAGRGYLVNIASVHASATLPGTSAYAAAKAGVVGLTRTLALELGPKRIRVNCVSPGAIETDALRAYFDSMPPARREAEQRHLLSWHPLGRIGQPEDIANLVVFLCSDKAAFIHGAEIVADGGCLPRLF